MPVNLSSPVAMDLLPINGVLLGTTEANIKKPNRKDLLIMQIDPQSTVAGVFTQNRFCAAPVTVAREHLAAGKGIRALVVNTGEQSYFGALAAEAAPAAATPMGITRGSSVVTTLMVRPSDRRGHGPST